MDGLVNSAWSVYLQRTAVSDTYTANVINVPLFTTQLPAGDIASIQETVSAVMATWEKTALQSVRVCEYCGF